MFEPDLGISNHPLRINYNFNISFIVWQIPNGIAVIVQHTVEKVILA